MGYYTDYTLTASGCKTDDSSYSVVPISKEVSDALYDAVRELNIFDNMGEKDLEFGAYAYAKWYDHDDDMLDLSCKFPDILFCLHGSGDSEDDKWDTYYLNGKLQVCPVVMTYEDFNPAKLREKDDSKGLPL